VRVSDEFFEVALGGRVWALPPLPFRLIRRLQPRLLRIVALFADAGPEDVGIRLDEKTIEEMLGVTAQALAYVDPSVTSDTLDDMVFTTAALVAAQAQVMAACGLVNSGAPTEGASGPKA
jgi:hypothetical protein